MAPGCGTFFVVMSADRGPPFEDAGHFSWGSLSTPHVTEPPLKETFRLLPGNLL